MQCEENKFYIKQLDCNDQPKLDFVVIMNNRKKTRANATETAIGRLGETKKQKNNGTITKKYDENHV